MSFLHENISENLAARITDTGRKKIAQGDFNVTYFQLGDSEFDYGFSEFDGLTYPAQKILMPFDKDSQVKYPYKISVSTLTGTTYGTPVQLSETVTIQNTMGAGGFVSEYQVTGSTIECGWEQIDISGLTGTSVLTVSDGSIFTGTTHITIFMNSLGTNDIITGGSISLVYRIVGITGNTIGLDRAMPDFSSFSGIPITIICNYCIPVIEDPEDQQDPWTLNIIWSANSAGLSQNLSGFTSNDFTSTKEFFGYNTSSGQTDNTGTTITNSFGDIIMVPPEEQHSLSLLHYSKSYDTEADFDLIFKYDDYISSTLIDAIDGREYFEIYIPFLQYERNTGTTIGARFFMDPTDYYINSSAIDTRINQMKYRRLLDENNNAVGKIFVNHKVIVFDDQEIVALLITTLIEDTHCPYPEYL